MDSRTLVGLIGAVVLLSSSLSRAGNEGRVEPLDGHHRFAAPPTGPERSKPFIPYYGSPPPERTPSGGPLPPGQLTPAPVLPFNPNRPLMPAPSGPSHPPIPAR